MFKIHEKRTIVNNAMLNVVAIVVVALVGSTFAGSCKMAKLCCQGRDSACVVQKVSPNAIIESPRDKPCYCDHACLKLDDCCGDYKETCGVVDCTVTEWSAWSICNKCSIEVQKRSRVILKPENNGGKHCPELVQSRTCQSHAACHRRDRGLRSRDVALLLPVESFRRNAAGEITTGHCATFTIIRASKACRKDSSLLSLVEGSHICVTCHDVTSRCQGNTSPSESTEATRWKVLTSLSTFCHGKWIRVRENELNYNSTKCQDKPHFAFV